ncbi:MAG: TolC family protein [Burkholderiales bacterium]
MKVRYLAALALPMILIGCATYQPKPLDRRPNMPNEVEHLTINTAQMPLPELVSHRFDPSDGLDIDEIAMLAVANNPQLRVARDELGIAQAQAFAAGLLPDPQLSLTSDFPTNVGPGFISAYNLGLSYDVSALLTRSTRKGAAEAQQRKVDLNLLWQEWQVVSQARLLFVRNLEQQRLMHVLDETRTLFAIRYQHAQQALQDGNKTLDAVSADLIALQDVERQINDLARQINRNRLDLNLLLGLAPEVRLDLVGETALPLLDANKVRAQLARIAYYRPDLLALQAGYQSQELRFRQAILAQFPALNIGITRARDTSNVQTLGFAITLSLPIFNRNQGNIAIEHATRQRLYDEFQQRLGATYSEVHGILDDQQLLEQQLANVNDALAKLEQVASNAEIALTAGNISELTYTGLRASLLNKRIEAVTLEQRILEQRIALQTLVARELPIKAENKGNEK